ncbi:hypothetical protein CKM354_000258200 [Cercospora kikuchii]|uniref:Fe2OG dioxygenase domain-containing protein n=1 Tax=Cercospora kikuchii TaxID=84275 RepID=A0A9P3CAJ0_9PEZI|nr:uncharacterized protein CKM354_000258200 [Cercospora kikuchii]GIZ39191.1 hypothetical protein CKM354_000258200 [Cercospora kikuchii]
MPHKESYVEFTPSRYPPFPDGLKEIELKTISLRKIQDADRDEQELMFEACKAWGFFYLDLSDSEQGEIISHSAEDVARVAEDVMAMPMDEKMKYPFDFANREVFGYKVIGQTKVDKNQTPDTAEFFNVAKNDMIVPDDQMKRAWPKPVLENKPLLATYCKTAHSVGLQILEVLAKKLGIDPEEIHRRHKIEELSGDHIRMTRGPPRKTADMPEIQTPSHTDFGTITILMNWLGGLQVYGSPNRVLGNLDYDDDTAEWMWVRPKKGCAIVNLGDAAVKFTNGVLCSGRHRVIPSPGEQGKWPRYSIVYFVRPAHECRLKTLKGSGVPEAGDEDEEGVNAKDWIFMQAERLAGR